MTKEELNKKAEQVFKQFPTANKVYVTKDGNVFLDKNRADLHVKGSRIFVIEKEIEPIETSDEPTKGSKKTVDEVVQIIMEAQSIEDLQEFEDDTRKGIIKAIGVKKAELQNADVDKTLTNTEE